MVTGNILIIDDEEKLRGLLARIMGLEGYRVVGAGNGKAGLGLLEKKNIQLVISDVKLPDIHGAEPTARIKRLYPLAEVVVPTAYGTIAEGVTGTKKGGFDCLVKGDDNDKIIPLVSRAMEKARLQQRVPQLEKQVNQKYNCQNIIGRAPVFRRAIAMARKGSQTDTAVRLPGETKAGFAFHFLPALERKTCLI